jgi:hypothetical protein
MTKIAKPTERDESQVLRDIDSENVRLVAGQHQIDVLQSRRRSLLAAGDVDGVVEIDEKIGRASVTVEIAEAKIVGLEAELESLYAAEREAQTAADLARAQQLADEGRQLVLGDYAKAAREIAETLARLATIESELSPLSARLQTYTDYIEVFRGHGATLIRTVVLPAITSEDAAFWPTRPRLQTINELYARN